jgi:hypothetical protein
MRREEYKIGKSRDGREEGRGIELKKRRGKRRRRG